MEDNNVEDVAALGNSKPFVVKFDSAYYDPYILMLDKKTIYADNPTINRITKEFKVNGVYNLNLVKASIKLSGFAQVLFVIAVEQLMDNTEGIVVLECSRLCDKYQKTMKTFYNAINNLIDNDVIYYSDRKNVYWINYKFIEQCIS